MSKKRTLRGFRIYAEIKDTNGNTLRVQQAKVRPAESSIADDDFERMEADFDPGAEKP